MENRPRNSGELMENRPRNSELMENRPRNSELTENRPRNSGELMEQVLAEQDHHDLCSGVRNALFIATTPRLPLRKYSNVGGEWCFAVFEA